MILKTKIGYATDNANCANNLDGELEITKHTLIHSQKKINPWVI